MFDISFKINGRKVRPDQIGNELEKSVKAEIDESIREAVSSVRCPIHGQRARIEHKGRRFGKVEFGVSGCCDELVRRVQEKLR